MKKFEEFSEEKKSGEWTSRQKNGMTERAMGVGGRTRDGKMESNHSPEIPDRGRHQISPASLQGMWSK